MPRSPSRCSLLCIAYSQFLTPNIIPHRSHVCTYPVTFLAIIAAQYQYTIMLIPAQMEEQHVNRYQHLDQAAAMAFLQSGNQIIFSYGSWFICIAKMRKNSRRNIVKCLKRGKNGQKQKRHWHCYSDGSSLILHRRVIGPHLWRNTTQCRRYGCNVLPGAEWIDRYPFSYLINWFPINSVITYDSQFSGRCNQYWYVLF